MKKILNQELSDYIGYKLAKDVYLVNQKVYNKDEVIDRQIIEFLKRQHKTIPFIFVYTDDTKEVVVKDSIDKNNILEVRTRLAKLLDNIQMRGSIDLSEVEDLSEQIVYLVGDIEDIPNIDTLFIYSNYLVDHSLNICLLSTLLALKAGISNSLVKHITQGSMLHDIGKIPIFKKYPYLKESTRIYNREDYKKILIHPLVGYKLISEQDNVPITVKKIILMHHIWDKRDASFSNIFKEYQSYPFLFQGKEIKASNKDLAVSIVQAADVFEAMLNNTRIEQLYNKKIALDYIQNMEGIQFSAGAKLLLKYIPLYNVGDEILINKGNKAVVLDNSNNMLFPMIKCLTGNYQGMVTCLDTVIDKNK